MRGGNVGEYCVLLWLRTVAFGEASVRKIQLEAACGSPVISDNERQTIVGEFIEGTQSHSKKR